MVLVCRTIDDGLPFVKSILPWVTESSLTRSNTCERSRITFLQRSLIDLRADHVGLRPSLVSDGGFGLDAFGLSFFGGIHAGASMRYHLWQKSNMHNSHLDPDIQRSTNFNQCIYYCYLGQNALVFMHVSAEQCFNHCENVLAPFTTRTRQNKSGV